MKKKNKGPTYMKECWKHKVERVVLEHSSFCLLLQGAWAEMQVSAQLRADFSNPTGRAIFSDFKVCFVRVE